MFRASETPVGGARANACDRSAAAPLSEPRLLPDGSIDYDFYEVCARHLRRACVAEAGAAAARLARRADRATAISPRVEPRCVAPGVAGRSGFHIDA